MNPPTNGTIADRLIYADWLESRGDDLATWIRLACEARDGVGSIPVRDRHAKLTAADPNWRVRIAAIRRSVLAPLVKAVDDAWQVCESCGGLGYWTTIDGGKRGCVDCRANGRVGKLWRDCPECDEGLIALPKVFISHDSDACDRCDGTGKLLEVPCGECGGVGTKTNSKRSRSCWRCDAQGYIPSPLAPLWTALALTYSPEAPAIRRCYVTAIAKLTGEFS